MTLPGSIKDREHAKFREGSNGGTSVSVIMDGDVGLLEGISYDDVQKVDIDPYTINFLYYKNSTLQATVEVTYSDLQQCNFLRARRV